MEWKAAGWVNAVGQTEYNAVPSASEQGGLDTTPLKPASVLVMRRTCVVLFEPFGGICAGLEMALRAGIPVLQYIYCDINQCVSSIAKVRVKRLQQAYPHLLSVEATKDSFSTLSAS